MSSDTDTERVMVDIETLGTEPGCSILSIGAVKFTTDGLGDEFYRSINLESCEAAGLEIDAGTLEWWLGQDDAAKDVLTGGVDLPDALQQFGMFVSDADEIWANSPSFDLAILKHASEATGAGPYWEFYQERDFRTLKKLPCAVDVDADGTDHDALDDAVYQARVAAATLRRLEGVADGE